MTNSPCPACGHPTPDASACPKCGHALANGTTKAPYQKPPPPPELVGCVFEKVPLEMIEEARRSFNEEEWLAALREFEENGETDFAAFIAEIEEIVNRRD